MGLRDRRGRAVENDQPTLDALAVDLKRLGPDVVVALDVTGSIATLLDAVPLAEGLRRVHGGPLSAIGPTTMASGIAVSRHVAPAEIRAAEIRAAGRRRLVAHPKKTPHLRDAEALADRALPAANARTTIVPGEAVSAETAPELAREALDARTRIARLCRELEALLDAHPDGALIRSLPGMGRSSPPELVAAAGDLARFRSPDAMAAAAGLAPALRQSGRSRAVRRARGGDRALERVFFQNVFCAVVTKDPLSNAFHEPRRRQGKHHTHAVIALAGRGVTVLWTMLRNRATFEPERYAA